MITFQYRGIGEIPKTKFRCEIRRLEHICLPLDADTRQTFVDLQREIDAFVNILPLFAEEFPDELSSEFEERFDGLEQVENPVGTVEGRKPLGTGYDGRIGPTTTKYGAVALIGAIDLLRAAGESGPPPNIAILSRRIEVDNWAPIADEVTAFLRSVRGRFDSLMSRARERAREKGVELPTTLAPPKVAVAKRAAKFPTGAVVGTAAAMAGIVGLAAWGAMRKKEQEPLPIF